MKSAPLTRLIAVQILLLAALMVAGSANAARVSVLIDLESAIAAQTVIVESLAADRIRVFYAGDRISAKSGESSIKIEA